ncbi:MAG: hypothetical protein ACK5HL_01625 [Bacilli bacterium]
MSYIRKEHRRILELSDSKFTIPSLFDRFVREKETLHNLIIKSKGGNSSLRDI